MNSDHSQNPGKKKKKKRKRMLRKLKNAMLSFLFLALVGATSVVVTWAVAGATGFGSVTNEFNSTSPISVEMAENFDREAADSYEPRSVIQKQPMVRNTSSVIENPTAESSHREWVAIKLSYTVTFPKTVYTARSVPRPGVCICPYFTKEDDEEPITCIYDGHSDFANAVARVSTDEPEMDEDGNDITATDGFNTEYWTAYDSTETLFIYNEPIDPQTTTPQPLFNWVQVLNHQNGEVDCYENNGSSSPWGSLALYPISTIGAKTYNSSGELQYAHYLDGVRTNQDTSDTVYVASLPTFDIKMTAYAVQADGLATLADARAPLHDLAFS